MPGDQNKVRINWYRSPVEREALARVAGRRQTLRMPQPITLRWRLVATPIEIADPKSSRRRREARVSRHASRAIIAARVTPPRRYRSRRRRPAD